jgi:hypothetical protein
VFFKGMIMNMRVAVVAVAGLACTFSVWGCKRGGEASPSPTAAAPAVALPAGLFAAAAPTGAKSVKEAKAAAEVGQSLVVKGRIGGGRDPFGGGIALFTLVDVALPTCKEMPGDTCKTPWDYCCEPPDNLTAHALTVQVVGADGKPLKTSLKGVNRLDPLAMVTVEGKVSQKLEGNIIVLDAAHIFVESAS